MEYKKVAIDEKYSIDTNGVLYNNFTNSVINVKFNETLNAFTIKQSSKRVTIHVELAKHFIPNPNNYKHVVFIDGNRRNCVVENLRWSRTQSGLPLKVKEIKVIKTIDDVEKLEDENFVVFNNERYNHYLISNYGRIFNIKSGQLFENKETHQFFNGDYQNIYNVILLLVKLFKFEDIKHKSFELIADDEIWETIPYENFTHYKISNYGRLFNEKTGLFKNYSGVIIFINCEIQKEITTLKVLLDVFSLDKIKCKLFDEILEDETFVYFEYDGTKYIISNYARCFSLIGVKPKKMCTKIMNDGYLCFKIGGEHVPVHKLVTKYFLEPIVGKNIINHIDGDKHNNKASNLEYCTYSENTQHYFDNKTDGIYGKKIVVQLDDNKNIINEFESISDAARTLDGSFMTTKVKISQFCSLYKNNNILRKYKGFHWVFKSDWVKE
jgi:hypothetical protein